MRKILAWVLIVTLTTMPLVTFTACSGGNSLVGSWEERQGSHPRTIVFHQDGTLELLAHGNVIGRTSWSEQDGFITIIIVGGNLGVLEYEIIRDGNDRILRIRDRGTTSWEEWIRVQ